MLVTGPWAPGLGPGPRAPGIAPPDGLPAPPCPMVVALASALVPVASDTDDDDSEAPAPSPSSPAPVPETCAFEAHSRPLHAFSPPSGDVEDALCDGDVCEWIAATTQYAQGGPRPPPPGAPSDFWEDTPLLVDEGPHDAPAPDGAASRSRSRSRARSSSLREPSASRADSPPAPGSGPSGLPPAPPRRPDVPSPHGEVSLPVPNGAAVTLGPRSRSRSPAAPQSPPRALPAAESSGGPPLDLTAEGCRVLALAAPSSARGPGCMASLGPAPAPLARGRSRSPYGPHTTSTPPARLAPEVADNDDTGWPGGSAQAGAPTASGGPVHRPASPRGGLGPIGAGQLAGRGRGWVTMTSRARDSGDTVRDSSRASGGREPSPRAKRPRVEAPTGGDLGALVQPADGGAEPADVSLEVRRFDDGGPATSRPAV